MKLFYTIWVDCILKAKSKPENSNDWKFYTLIFMSMSMALNLWFISFLLLAHANFSSRLFPLRIDIFPGTKLDAFFSFFISYLLPFLLLNYALIFYKDRYKILLDKYKYYNGKLFIRYFLGSIGIMFLYFIIAFIGVRVLLK